MATKGINNTLQPPYVNNGGQVEHRLEGFVPIPPGWQPKSYRERFSRLESEARMVWCGPWSSRLLFRDSMLGVSRNIGDARKGTLSRLTPQQHPEMPELVAVSCELVEAGATTALSNDSRPQFASGKFVPASLPLPMIAYVANPPPDVLDDGQCDYEVRYADPGFEVRSDFELAALARAVPDAAASIELNRWVTRESTYSLQGLPISKIVGSTLQFTEGNYAGQVVPEAGVLPIWTQDLVYTWHEVTDVPEAAIAACIGKVNDRAFDVLGADRVGHDPYPPGTLLCQTPTKKRHRLQNGRVAWTIVYHLLFRPEKHNSFPGPDGVMAAASIFGPPRPPLAQGPDLGPVFKSAPFDTLFAPGPVVRWQ